MNKHLSHKAYIKIFVACLVIALIIQFIYSSKKLNSLERYTGSYLEPSEYSALFNKDSSQHHKFLLSYASNIKNIIGYYSFEKKYAIFIFKINTDISVPLSKLLQDGIGNNSLDFFSNKPEHYTGRRENNFAINFSFDTINHVDQIIQTVSGDYSNKYIANDSTICYTYSLSNYSVKYSPKSPIDIIVDKTGSKNIRFNVLFLKRNQNTYIIMMSPINDATLADNQILSIINI